MVSSNSDVSEARRLHNQNLAVACILIDRYLHENLGDHWRHICSRLLFPCVPSWRQLIIDRQLVRVDLFDAYLLWRRQTRFHPKPDQDKSPESTHDPPSDTPVRLTSHRSNDRRQAVSTLRQQM